jgi:polysaccharide export outer membrane protein
VVPSILKAVIGSLLLLRLSACTLPRGAPLQNEITKAAENEEAAFQVVPVLRENIEILADWPVTGWAGHYRWFEANRGPASAIIKAGDTISLTIWDSQESSLLTTPTQRNVILPDMTVSAGGTIFLPYVDEIVIRGLTPSDARRRLQKELEGIVPSAQVQLKHTPGHRNMVDAVRGFATPGSYPMPDRNFSILSLISEAGGISTSLRNPLVRVIRGQDTFEIQAKTLLEEANRNVTLRGGDKVIVDEDDRSFIALGATGREELVYFDQDYLTTLEALAQVGGLSDARANLKGVLILRDYPEDALRDDDTGPSKRQVVFAFDLTSADGLFAARAFQVNPEDVVIASESPINSLQTIFGLVGSVVGISNAVSND